MKDELNEALVRDFPRLFKEQPYVFCGDGWEPLIREAAQKIEALMDKIPKEELEQALADGAFQAMQIKEKFGTMRFYLSSATDEMWKVAEEAERKSQAVCEECGVAGSLRNGGWLKTLCDSCHSK
jgi:alkylation response protein AidB-like acyl-CoA dehydrogenase